MSEIYSCVIFLNWNSREESKNLPDQENLKNLVIKAPPSEAIWNDYQLIGDSILKQLLRRNSRSQEEYRLCRSDYKFGYKLKHLVHDVKKNSKLCRNKVIVYIGINVIKQKEFDVTIWRLVFQELITIIKSQNEMDKTDSLKLQKLLKKWENVPKKSENIFVEAM